MQDQCAKHEDDQGADLAARAAELAARETELAAREAALAAREAECATRNAEAAFRDAEIEDVERDGVSRDSGTDVETRLELLEEQELALEAYLRLSADGPLWRWVAPQLGILYQHDPAPFHVPEHYLRVRALPTSPLISIVTPTMNSEQFVTFTIDSVVTQGYPNLEYIIQDGDSSDETLEIVKSYGSKIAHVNSARDTGMSQAINRGFSHATGEILAYLNSDDLLLPGSLHYVAAYFASHPDVDVVYGHRVIVNMENSEIGRWVLPPHDSDVLSWADYVPQETLFWRRRIWDEVGSAMDESFRFACDWDLLLRLREAGATFVRLPRFLGAFRVHEEQKTSKQLADVGASEMTRLRERYVGRPVEAEEIWHHIQPYLHRHKVYHKLYRLGVLRY
jgi:glycosyltransferase involved in cell wall biosynthesis